MYASVVTVYALTYRASQEVKDRFFDDLQHACAWWMALVTTICC